MGSGLTPATRLFTTLQEDVPFYRQKGIGRDWAVGWGQCLLRVMPLHESPVVWAGVATGILVKVLGESLAAHGTCQIWPTHGSFLRDSVSF